MNSKDIESIKNFLNDNGIEYVFSNTLKICRDSIVNHYKNRSETEAYEKLLQDIEKLGIRSYYNMQNDDYLWLYILPWCIKGSLL